LLGGIHDVIAVVLGSQLERLSIISLNELLEVLADDLLVDQELVLGDVGDLEKHG